MWIIIVVLVAVFLFYSYSRDKGDYRNRVTQAGGMLEIFSPLVSLIREENDNVRIIKNEPTKLEITATTRRGRSIYFGVKLGFNNGTNVWCDNRQIGSLQAASYVEGNISNQLQCYEMLVGDMIIKGKI